MDLIQARHGLATTLKQIVSKRVHLHYRQESNTPCLTPLSVVRQAILSSPEHRLSFSEIYDWITTVYPFFSPATTSWKNSIRHTLCSYQCFRNEAHGIWAINDADLENYGSGSLQNHDYGSSRVDSVRKISGRKDVGTTTGSGNDDLPIPKLKT
ncbi:winged helix DNA-binding domain-containing protein [Guyanagaster necrorhizus]|uniref:Winged helix DNA-binding domain-containing protein n=1 Tax=Guyanagaster necrorhizus TaxID=856835 RepID=A0A9P8AQT1_9AGAR|nr:winged helix DNA-binding domain-containing protein [Guyanagaster necrorhizus MCA 3950]KAG7444335.1 winged helix DNA-binding domain-containing protein [Guyanagaster necrorhizus MCA 3950]